MDHYQRFSPEADGRDGYCQNLEVMREQSLAAGVPFWNFFNTMPYGSHTDPTEAQLRWQINASLAYGAKGVMYFCYWTPGGAEFPKAAPSFAATARAPAIMRTRASMPGSNNSARPSCSLPAPAFTASGQRTIPSSPSKAARSAR